jgi:hypothetical protein
MTDPWEQEAARLEQDRRSLGAFSPATYLRALARMLAIDPSMGTRYRDGLGLARYVLAEAREDQATIGRWEDDGGHAA